MVVDHDVGVVRLSPPQGREQEIHGDLFRVAGVGPPGEHAHSGLGVDRGDVLEGEIGPFLGRTVREVDEALLGRHLEHGGHVPDPDIGIEQEHPVAGLLAERDGHVDGDGRLADPALGSEDADHAAFAHHRHVAHLGGHCSGISRERAAGAYEHGLEPIDERLGGTRLHGVLVATRPVLRRLVPEDQNGRNAPTVVKGGVQLLRHFGLLVAVDGCQVDVWARFVEANRLETRSAQSGLGGGELAVGQREQDVWSLHSSFRCSSVCSGLHQCPRATLERQWDSGVVPGRRRYWSGGCATTCRGPSASRTWGSRRRWRSAIRIRSARRPGRRRVRPQA